MRYKLWRWILVCTFKPRTQETFKQQTQDAEPLFLNPEPGTQNLINTFEPL